MSHTPLTTKEKSEIVALLASGYTANAVGRKLGRDRKTIVTYSARDEVIAEIGGMQELLAEEFEALALRMVQSITDEDITNINAYQRTIAASAATDKLRLLRNQSTQNIATIMASAAIEAGKMWQKAEVIDIEL